MWTKHWTVSAIALKLDIVHTKKKVGVGAVKIFAFVQIYAGKIKQFPVKTIHMPYTLRCSIGRYIV